MEFAQPSLGIALAWAHTQEERTMALDMTAELAPMIWGMIALLAISGVSLLVASR